jgi:hypothetical protein
LGVSRQTCAWASGLIWSRRHGHPDDCVRTESRLRGRAVQRDQRSVQLRQTSERPGGQRPSNLPVDVADRVQHAGAAIPARVAVAKLHRLPRARRRTGRNPALASNPSVVVSATANVGRDLESRISIAETDLKFNMKRP